MSTEGVRAPIRQARLAGRMKSSRRGRCTVSVLQRGQRNIPDTNQVENPVCSHPRTGSLGHLLSQHLLALALSDQPLGNDKLFLPHWIVVLFEKLSVGRRRHEDRTMHSRLGRCGEVVECILRPSRVSHDDDSLDAWAVRCTLGTEVVCHLPSPISCLTSAASSSRSRSMPPVPNPS